jgi:hypothetical protein
MHFVEPAPTDAPGGEAPGQMHAEILDSFLFLGAISARPDEGGNFSFRNVYPGSYRIVPMLPPPLPNYLDAVRVGETDVGGAEVELSSEAVPVTVVYKTNGGALRGTVEKCASGPVLLVPQDTARQWLGFLRAARCDSNDRYGIAGVRPGEYYEQGMDPCRSWMKAFSSRPARSRFARARRPGRTCARFRGSIESTREVAHQRASGGGDSYRLAGESACPTALAGFEEAHPPGGAAGFEPFIGFLLLFRRHDRLASVAAFPDSGPRDEIRAAPATLLGHGLLERENTGFLGQQMRIMEIAMIHVRHLVCVGNQTSS